MGTHGVESGMKGTTNEERKQEREERDRSKYLDFNDVTGENHHNEYSYFQKESDAWQNRIDSDELDAVQEYTGSHYRAMNKYLREGKLMSGEDPKLEDDILNCANGIKQFNLKTNLMAYRKSSAQLLDALGLSASPHNAQAFANEVKKAVGSVVRDKGFTSTSTRKSTWSGDVYYEIKVPKGTNCAYVEHVSLHSTERELILNRGTYFKITGARVEGTHPIVELKIVKKP